MRKSNDKLSNLQLELLKIYSKDVSNSELNDIKALLANYFAKKAVNKADKIWNEKNYDNSLMDKWLNENN